MVMNSEKAMLFDMQAEFCSVMANPKRLMIIDFISRKGEASVGEIAAEVESTVSLVSQHLRLMRDKNVALSRRVGHTVLYRLKHPKLMKGCHAVQAVLKDELEGRAQMARTLGE